MNARHKPKLFSLNSYQKVAVILGVLACIHAYLYVPWWSPGDWWPGMWFIWRWTITGQHDDGHVDREVESARIAAIVTGIFLSIYLLRNDGRKQRRILATIICTLYIGMEVFSHFANSSDMSPGEHFDFIFLWLTLMGVYVALLSNELWRTAINRLIDSALKQ